MKDKSSGPSAGFQLDVSDREDSVEAKLLHERLRDHVEDEVGPSHRKAFVVLARQGEEVHGGARGYSHWGWLYISHLWVATSGRSKGLGAELLRACEKEAASRKCTGLYVDTFSDRARAFYLREGFKLVGEIPDFPKGFCRAFLEKRL